MSTTRAERRRRTEERILDAARALFAERGFERTTIRAVATAASVDPALVMQYFGSKRELFGQAALALPARSGGDEAGGPARGDEGVIEGVLDTLGVRLGGLPAVSLAMMRSMLTHPEAAESARAMLRAQIDQISAALPGQGGGGDSRLRAALLTSIMVGVTVGHQLLGIDDLRDTPAEEIARVLRPALSALIESPRS
ncbi:TetR/AcrR family transcriptional regulator [Spongiactinospora rosea]|uniref:TetR/AcrR family transcriptional regulator n=1 Tax=Spongiactinospora rosea TaxID=2248750 RepID=UPI0018F76BFA|nr:TetR/AcrR family transcriptional regulator [Spongiactinospora rosea]